MKLTDEQWAKKAMELATDFAVESLRLGDYEARRPFVGCDKWNINMLREKREAARERLRQHLYTPPQQQQAAPGAVPDGFALLISDAVAEGEKAMRKFPQPNYTLLKVAEESGEVVKACVHLAEGRDTAEHVRDEMKQAVAMIYRLWREGDQVNGVPAISDLLSAAPKPQEPGA